MIQAIKFGLISASAGIIQASTFALFDSVLKLGYQTSYLISLALSVIWNFTINRKVTFKSSANVPIAMLKVAAFYAVFTLNCFLNGKYNSVAITIVSKAFVEVVIHLAIVR